MKKYSKPKAKAGELKAQWGKFPGDDPDLCYVWGEGIERADFHLLYVVLTQKKYRAFDNTWEDGFIYELEKRGYDLTTLKFSVRKKK